MILLQSQITSPKKKISNNLLNVDTNIERKIIFNI